MDVHSPSVSLVPGRHVGGGIVVLNASDFGLSCVDCALELVNAPSGLRKSLVGGCASAVDGRNEAVGDGVGCVSEGVVLHAEEGRS